MFGATLDWLGRVNYRDGPIAARAACDDRRVKLSGRVFGGLRAGLLRVVVVGGLVAAVAGCGGDSEDSPAFDGGPDAPVLDLAGIRTLPIGPHDVLKATAAGLVAVADGELRGIDPRSGETRWTVRQEGLRPDPKGVELQDFGNVLLVSWVDSGERVAYAADSGRELWRTPDPEWSEQQTRDGQFVQIDPRTNARKWSVSYTELGCAGALPEDHFYLFEARGATLFRCPLRVDGDSVEGEQLVGALNLDTGALLWKRTVPDRRSFARATYALAEVTVGKQQELIEGATGRIIGTRTKSDPEAQLRYTLPDGAAFVLDSSTIKDNHDFRLEEADGTVRWRVPLSPTEEMLPEYVGTGNVVLGTMHNRLGSYDCWLLAYDMRTGKRIVVAGPGKTEQGEQPTLNKAMELTGTVSSAPWGVLVGLKDGEFAVIPAE